MRRALSMPPSSSNPTPGGKRRVQRPAGDDARPIADLTPEELACRAQSGSTACYGELVVRFEQRLFNFLLRRVRNADEAQDLTQEAFVRAWERLASYDSRWNFSTWLYTIAIRLAVSRSRRAGLIRSGVAPELLDPVCPADAAPSDMADRALGARIWAMADEVLTEDQRTAVWLRYAEDMSIEQIARVMGKTQVGVRVILFRARQSLADACRGVQGFEEHTAQAGAASEGTPPPRVAGRWTGGRT